MSSLVVDASVAVKWLLPEIHGDAALRVLEQRHDLSAPDLIYPETGNVLWKRVSRGELSESEAKEAMHSLCHVPIEVHTAKSLMPLALEIACGSGTTVYDSLYLSVAFINHSLLITADRKFYDSIKTTPLADHIIWVEDEL